MPKGWLPAVNSAKVRAVAGLAPPLAAASERQAKDYRRIIHGRRGAWRLGRQRTAYGMGEKSIWLSSRCCYGMPTGGSVSSTWTFSMSAMSGLSAVAPMFQFSTRGIARPEGLAAWREIFGRTVCNLNIDPLEPETFASDATICQLPGLGVLFAESGAVDLSHPRELIVDDDLSFMAAPTCRYTAFQLGRTAELGAGAGVLMTNAEVGRIRLAAASRFITFRVPRAPMAALVPDIDAAVARRIPADNAALKLLVGYLESARDTLALTTPELQHAAVTHIHDLLALALGATREATEIAYGRGMRAARLRAAKAFIMRHIGRQDLSARTVAAHLNITPRYVHVLFEAEGSSVTRFIVALRLARSHHMLVDPRMTQRTISAIAFAAGFSDLSHFNRTFRRHFGKTPSDARRETNDATAAARL
jgi:AraC-like DNA-binding protein